MTKEMIDKDAKNEKLAKWAGIEHKEIRLNAQEPYITKMVWVIGAGEEATDDPPDFPNDLNACFRWLVPKLDWWSLSQKAQGKVVLAQVRLGNKSKTEGNNPASLALCLAILKLIDEDTKNES